jgi:allantoinase
LAAGGISAFKLSTYEYDAVRFPRIHDPTMLAAFREIAKTGLPVAIHDEDQELVEILTAQASAWLHRGDHALPATSAAARS